MIFLFIYFLRLISFWFCEISVNDKKKTKKKKTSEPGTVFIRFRIVSNFSFTFNQIWKQKKKKTEKNKQTNKKE